MKGYGAIVGSRDRNLADRIVVTIESFDADDTKRSKKPHEFHLLTNKEQAAVLGNCLIEISGQTSVQLT